MFSQRINETYDWNHLVQCHTVMLSLTVSQFNILFLKWHFCFIELVTSNQMKLLLLFHYFKQQCHRLHSNNY